MFLGCSLQDRHGYLPLQYACASLLPYPIIKAIVELYPEGWLRYISNFMPPRLQLFHYNYWKHFTSAFISNCWRRGDKCHLPNHQK